MVMRIPPGVAKDTPYAAVYDFAWLSAAGTACLLASLCAMVTLKISISKYLGILGACAKQLKFSMLTLACVLGLAQLMNYSGATATMGLAFAATGVLFPFFSSLLGWLAVFLTGSDTSANALFAKLQQTAGLKAGIDPNLLVAGNTSGGVVGKLISPQNLAIAASAVNLEGQESVILRKVVGWSVALLLVLCTLSYLQSTPVLSWMLP